MHFIDGAILFREILGNFKAQAPKELQVCEPTLLDPQLAAFFWNAREPLTRSFRRKALSLRHLSASTVVMMRNVVDGDQTQIGHWI